MTIANPNDFMEKIYAEYFRKVTSYVRSHIDRVHDQEDIVHDVFLKVYANLDKYDEGRSSISTWIYTITKNTVIDYYKSRKSSLPLEESTAEDSGLDEDIEVLSEALSRLDKRERDLIILHYYKGYTLKNIAEMMDISYIYAKVIHKKTLKDLEKLLGE